MNLKPCNLSDNINMSVGLCMLHTKQYMLVDYMLYKKITWTYSHWSLEIQKAFKKIVLICPIKFSFSHYNDIISNLRNVGNKHYWLTFLKECFDLHLYFICVPVRISVQIREIAPTQKQMSIPSNCYLHISTWIVRNVILILGFTLKRDKLHLK